MQSQLNLFADPQEAAAKERRAAKNIRRRERVRAAIRAERQGRHTHSLEAYADESRQQRATARRAAIVGWLRDHGPATDRQVLAGLFPWSGEMNLVRPRISELLDCGALVEVGKTRDPHTGRTVRCVAVSGGAA